jgi:D-sedoheptulose 7-phosphate isomerase
VFGRQLEALVAAGDVVAGFSTGGTSANVVRGLQAARERGATTVLFAGRDGGPALVPSTTTARIQEMHLLMLHLISEGVDAWAAEA